MTKARKIFMWGISGAGILLIVLTALALLLPHVLDTDAIGRSLAAELEARYHIRSEHIEISFLPSPCMVMHGVRTTVPETLTASAEAVSIHPEILPLFKGKFSPAEIELLSPTITARLPEQAPATSAKSSSQRLLRLKERISQSLATLFAAMPGVVIDARNGRLELYTGQNRVFFFEEIDLRTSVNTQRVRFELTSGESDLWQALAFSGSVDFGTLESSGELNLTGGNPGDLLRYLNTPLSDSIGDSRIDLSLVLSTDGLKSVRADFTASVPQFTIDGGPRGTVMSNGALVGALAIDNNGVDFSLSHFRFDHPRVNLTLNYVERYSDQSVTLNIDGRETDAASVKDTLLAVYKEDPVVPQIFEIIRKAEVPSILFSAHVNNASDLKELENFTIKGSIEKGVVFAPGPDLLVSNVSGNLLIEGGILSATNISGQTAGSSTSNGTLRIGLHGSDAPFHLDLPLTADLSELLEVLNRVVDNEAFRRELSQVKNVTGKAQGRLVLGESLKAVTVRAESGPFQLSGQYGRLPGPIDLEGAYFLLEGSKVSLASLAGKSGKSSFEGVDINYGWGKKKLLEIDSRARSFVSMDFLSPYLRAHEYWKTLMDGASKGLLTVNSLRFSGPPADRSKWIFNASGSVEDVVFQTKLLNGPLTLKSGAFEINGEQIALREIGTVLADSSLVISGSITGYLDQPKKVNLQLSGRLGPEGNKIAASLAGLPNSLRAIANVDLGNSRLTWDKGSKTAFQGEMQLSSGPMISINLVKTPQGLSIENLTIKDEDSDAAISLDSVQNQLKIGFSGILSNKTADRLLIDNRLLTGVIAGKFNARLYLDTPDKSSAQGEVKISGFQLPVNLPVPARIENAEIEADGNKINVKSAMISWSGSRLSLAGSVEITVDAYLVDMNAFADTLDLESILKSGEDIGKDRENPARPGPGYSKRAWKAPLRGTIRVRCEQLSYGRFAWNPADADVVLSPGSVEVRFNQANLCGISTPGRITVTPEGRNATLSPSAKDQDLESALSCLFNKHHILSGSYTLTGNLAARGSDGSLAESLEGEVELKAKKGRIFRFETFAKIISLLGITEIYRGVLPDLAREGCAYNSLESKGKIKNGKLVLSDSVIDGQCFKMVFHGEIDIVRQKVDVVALVAPLRTMERVVGATPVMGKILDEAFLTVPVSIKGDLADPAVVPLAPSAVGEELFGVMKKIFKLPLSIFQPPLEKEATHGTDSPKPGN
ncbi:MAG: AsmA-like C-terminal region-containing protein [Syntrophobacteraceae bacterium]|jgi:hypothetical protein